MQIKERGIGICIKLENSPSMPVGKKCLLSGIIPSYLESQVFLVPRGRSLIVRQVQSCVLESYSVL